VYSNQVDATTARTKETTMNTIYDDVTSETITRQQIIDLRGEATTAGDDRMADICGQALAGDEDSVRACERAIAAARAQEEV
jgi:hypothetical protein